MNIHSTDAFARFENHVLTVDFKKSAMVFDSVNGLRKEMLAATRQATRSYDESEALIAEMDRRWAGIEARLAALESGRGPSLRGWLRRNKRGTE